MTNMDETGESTAKLANPMIGTKLGGQYTIVSIIGEGGMGMIYRGRQDLVDRDVAIKFLPQALAQDEVNVQRLAREAKALGRLNHANIVTTFDFGFTDKREPYLVFEYVDGESLQNYLARRGPMPYREAVPIFIQVADAMKYAHSNDIVHRDLKPHNIMIVEKDGRNIAKVLDFGIAQIKSETQKLTRAGEVWGSPNYMSPEQCTGEPVDHLTDIYSLGVVMYKTLSGVVPNTGKTFTETVRKKLNEPAPFFSSLELEKPVEVPPGLEEIVIKCLRRYPDERYQTMADLKGSLQLFARAEHIGESQQNLSGAGAVEPAVTPAKTSAVKKPVPTGALSSGSKTAALPRSGHASRTAAKKGGNPLTKIVLPVVALLSVLMVLAIGYFVGKVQEDRALKDAATAGKKTPLPSTQSSAGRNTSAGAANAPNAPNAPAVSPSASTTTAPAVSPSASTTTAPAVSPSASTTTAPAVSPSASATTETYPSASSASTTSSTVEQASASSEDSKTQSNTAGQITLPTAGKILEKGSDRHQSAAGATISPVQPANSGKKAEEATTAKSGASGSSFRENAAATVERKLEASQAKSSLAGEKEIRRRRHEARLTLEREQFAKMRKERKEAMDNSGASGESDYQARIKSGRKNNVFKSGVRSSDDTSGGAVDFARRYRAGDENFFYRELGGARDSH